MYGGEVFLLPSQVSPVPEDGEGAGVPCPAACPGPILWGGGSAGAPLPHGTRVLKSPREDTLP